MFEAFHKPGGVMMYGIPEFRLPKQIVEMEIATLKATGKPVIVEDADSYNCFWQMPFRKSARIEIVNQSEKRLSLLYYNIDWIQKPNCCSAAP